MVNVAGNMQEEFVQAVLTVHTYVHTHMCMGQRVIYRELLCVSFILTHVCMYVCMYVQSTLPVQIGTTCSYIGSYCIILTVLCGIPMYNIVQSMLTVWDNWFLKGVFL